MLQKTYDLIREREIRGIRITVIGKLLLLGLMVPIMVFTAHNPGEAHSVLGLNLPIIAALFFALWILRKKKAVFAAGNISVAVDLLLVVSLPFIWYNSVGADTVSRAFLLKTFIPAIIYVLLMVNTITLRPWYPLAFCAGASLFYIFLYIFALQDPRLILSMDFLKTYRSEAVNPSLYFSNIALTLSAGAILAFIAGRARRTIIESAEYEVQNTQLARYFSPNVVDTITGQEELFRPGGSLNNVTVMFTDIRSFTTLSEQLSPEEVLALLSEYHSFMVEIIFRHGGTLDKFIGDGIMATFGTPEPSPDDPENAVRAALEMRRALQNFNVKRESRNLSPINHGIGIHTGPAIVGNVGIENRLEYTVIGDTVNTASRIESQCKEFQTDILISGSTKPLIPENILSKSTGEITLRGRREALELFSLPAQTIGTEEER